MLPVASGALVHNFHIGTLIPRKIPEPFWCFICSVLTHILPQYTYAPTSCADSACL